MGLVATPSILPPGLPGRRSFRSLGLWTDVWVLGPDSRVTATAEALAVRTPSVPTFRWGNVLVLRRPMRSGDGAARGAFARRVARGAALGHVTLAWDDPDGSEPAADELAAAGFELERTTVLAAPALGAPEPPSGVELRPLRSDADWAAALAFQAGLHPATDGGEAYRRFRSARNEAYRRMADAGLGRWYGAFEHGSMVADLGIYHHDGVARYQAVETHPDHRGRGIASALIREAARYAVRARGAAELVILAEPDGRALPLYRRLGFREIERLVGAVWREPDPDGPDGAPRTD